MSKGVKVKVKVQPTVVLEAEVARKIRQHSRSSMKAEVCGVLLGTAAEDRTVVEACIPGINAAQGGAHVTFTQDTWEHIYKIKDQQFPDMKIVGWYHSHPGFGVFLSEHDLFIQENFFSSPQQIAWVYDPHTDEEGCFGWIGGKIEKLPGIRFGYSQSVDASGTTMQNEEAEDGDLEPVIRLKQEPAGKEPEWVKWTGRVLMAFSLSALGFSAGLYFWELSPWARSVLRPLAQDLQRDMEVQQLCQPELQSCQSRLLRNPFDPLTPSGPAAAAPSPQPSPHPEQKEPARAGKTDNGKH
jgi:proteasome lid subunit RPN8/RPN11